MKLQIFTLIFISSLILKESSSKKCPFGYGEDNESKEFLQE